MNKLTINPQNEQYYSKEFVRGWRQGVQDQYDAFNIVTCQECKWWGDDDKILECCIKNKGYLVPTDADFWCKNGERK